MRKIIPFIGLVLFMSACQESLEEKAAKEADTYTRKNCPVKLTEMITMDSMTFDKATHTFGYYYSLSGAMDDSAALNPGLMRDQLKAGVKNMTAARVYMEEGYGFLYVYHSTKDPQSVLFKTLFTEKDYR